MSSSSATAVQSVYIAAVAEPLPSSQLHRPRPLLRSVLLALLVWPLPLQAGVVFDNCRTTADGGYSCDTRPTGNTLLDDQAARYGLFNAASPGWNEFSPYQDLDDELGDTGF